MQKFIITNDGELRFGHVDYHRELIPWGEDDCLGGGFWRINAGGQSIDLYGRSFDFGPADFDRVHSIDWTGIGGRPVPLFFYPHYPDPDDALPIYAR